MIIGCEIFHTHTSADSMAWAKEHLDIAPDGAIFFVENLTHARGRQGREWQLADGQLTLTILLKPPSIDKIQPEQLALRLNQLNMALTLGILEPLKVYGVGLKWPNDFVVKDRKVGGMLLEAVWRGQKLAGIVLGFSINVNNVFDESNPLYYTAISLKTVEGKELDSNNLQDMIVQSLDAAYAQWNDGNFDFIFEQWKSNQVYHGKNIAVHNKDGTIVSGIFVDVLPNGDLEIQNDNKTTSTIAFCTVEVVTV